MRRKYVQIIPNHMHWTVSATLFYITWYALYVLLCSYILQELIARLGDPYVGLSQAHMHDLYPLWTQLESYLWDLLKSV